jgi:hypothetical protein
VHRELLLITGPIPLGEIGEWHSLQSRHAGRATTTSGIKVAQHSEGLTLTAAQGGGVGSRRRSIGVAMKGIWAGAKRRPFASPETG